MLTYERWSQPEVPLYKTENRLPNIPFEGIRSEGAIVSRTSLGISAKSPFLILCLISRSFCCLLKRKIPCKINKFVFYEKRMPRSIRQKIYC